MTATDAGTGTLLDVALAAHAAGIAVVPPKEDGSKRPDGTWLRWQHRRPDEPQIRAWYGDGRRQGIGVLTGAVSGNLEMLEFEGRATHLWKPFVDNVRAAGMLELLERILNGYAEHTPSGGVHLVYRCTGPVTGNQKLARDVDVNGEVQVLIETRGEGGYVIVAPSAGGTHPTGKPWTIRHGSFANIATISPPDRSALLALASEFDRLGARPDQPRSERAATTTPHVGESWMDQTIADFNERQTWSQILEPLGWTFHHSSGQTDYWTRPGKDTRLGHSASVNHLGTDRLIAFTSSTRLESYEGGPTPAPSYDRFGVWAELVHGGNRVEAAKAARLDGYGPAWEEHKSVDMGALIGASYQPPASNGHEPPSEPADTADDQKDTETEEAPKSRFQPGGSWILDAPATAPAIWGADDQVLWAAGEPCLLTGPPGVGKTTLVGQVVKARLGLADELLGWPIQPETRGRVLYLASDRPQQIRRSLNRHFTEADRAALDDRLVIWPGPPPADLGKHPELLLQLAHEAGAATVILDSLKDMAIGLTDDEVGAGINRAIQTAIAADVEVLALHHQRKSTDGKRPKSLEDLYGSIWIAAGAGSVLLLWGQAGDLVVELHHLKQPASDVGPLKVEHDHAAGTTTLDRGFDLVRVLRSARNGLTPGDVARMWLDKDKPTDNERKKAKRRLDNLVQLGIARREDGQRDTDGTLTAARYYRVDDLSGLVEPPFSERAEK